MSVDEEKEKGNKAFKEKNYVLAVEAYSSAIEIGGADAVLFSNRSAAYASLGNWLRAKEDAMSCTDMRSTWPKGWSRLGAAEFGLGNFSAACDAYKRALQLDPDNAQIKQELANAESKKGTPPPRASSSSSSSSSSSYGSSKSSGKLSSSQLTAGFVVFLANLAVVFLSVISLVPGDGVTQWEAFINAMLASLVSLLIGIFRTHGFPNVGTLKKVWTVMRTKQGGDQSMFAFLQDPRLHYLMYSSLFLTSAPSFMFLIPINMLAVFSICTFLNEATPSLSPALHSAIRPLVTKVSSRWDDIDRLNANAEVIIFFVQIFQIFTPQRNLLLTGLYAHAFLRIRYMSNAHAKVAWGNVRQNSDKVFKHPQCPALVTSVYNRIVSFASGLGNPTA